MVFFLFLWQLQSQISKLKKQLGDEKKKSDDLQNSVDEAKFCEDELDVRIFFSEVLWSYDFLLELFWLALFFYNFGFFYRLFLRERPEELNFLTR